VAFAQADDEVMVEEGLGGGAWGDVAWDRGGEGDEVEDAHVGAGVVFVFVKWSLRYNFAAAEGGLSEVVWYWHLALLVCGIVGCGKLIETFSCQLQWECMYPKVS